MSDVTSAISSIHASPTGHGKKKNKWQKDNSDEAAAAVVPAGPKKEVPKPYMADAKYVINKFQTTGMKC